MESDIRFYIRRAQAETLAALNAVTPQARDRRLQLAEQFLRKLEPLCADAVRHQGRLASLAIAAAGQR